MLSGKTISIYNNCQLNQIITFNSKKYRVFNNAFYTDIKLFSKFLSPIDNLHYEKFSDGNVKCVKDEIPFDVPDGWTWARLNDLALYKKGPFGSSITKAMFVPESDEAIKVYEQKMR